MVFLAKEGSLSRVTISGHGGGRLPTESHPLEVEGETQGSEGGRNRLPPRDNFLPSALISIQQDEMGASAGVGHRARHSKQRVSYGCHNNASRTICTKMNDCLRVVQVV